MRLLIIGCGAIGQTLAKVIDTMEEVDLFYMTDKNEDRAQQLVSEYRKAKFIANTDESIRAHLKHLDLVVEAASQDAVAHYVPFILGFGKDVLVMSVGAFADDALRQKCFNLAKKKGGRLYVPSGAVCGTDGLHSASVDKIDSVELISIKGPKSFKDNPYLKTKGIDVDKLKERTVIYEGPAREAIIHFPKNVNVSATISLLGLGLDKTKVQLICDPFSDCNTHKLIVKGVFGEITAETENVPFPSNPATSYLAALSAIAAIKRIAGNVWIGI
ncbi:MAG: aspartate dehydrogenase [Methanomassiliicoccales archaeon]|nr:MAG: aspartate dehydrogenase [Methanomassiliicoccales archaeon]